MNSEATNLRSRLEQFGDPRKTWRWQTGEFDYLAQVAVSAEDIPELVTIALEWAEPIDWPDDKNFVAGYAPIHAWRCLAQLRAEQAIHPLLDLMDRLSEADDDWFLSEFPHVFAWIGPAALEPLGEYLSNNEHEDYPRVAAIDALIELGMRYPETRDAIVAGLIESLSRYAENGMFINAFLIGALIDLEAVEAAELIERTYAANCVDISINGNWNEVRERLGVEGLGLVPEELASRLAFPSFLPPAPESDNEPSPKGRRDDWATIRSSDKVGRNDPCPCGSGKKYKKCCGR